MARVLLVAKVLTIGVSPLARGIGLYLVRISSASSGSTRRISVSFIESTTLILCSKGERTFELIEDHPTLKICFFIFSLNWRWKCVMCMNNLPKSIILKGKLVRWINTNFGLNVVNYPFYFIIVEKMLFWTSKTLLVWILIPDSIDWTYFFASIIYDKICFRKKISSWLRRKRLACISPPVLT